MSFISIDLRGAAPVAAALARAPQRLAWHVDRALARAAAEIARQMRQDAPKGVGPLTQSVKDEHTGPLEYWVGPHVRYARYVEEGTTGGGWVPDEALRRWLRLKGIKPRTPGMSEDDLVYVIGRAIHARGSRAQPFVEPIADSPFFRQRVQQLVDGAVAAALQEVAQ